MNDNTLTINHLVHFDELLLTWKDTEGSNHVVGTLTNETFKYVPNISALQEKGFNGYPAFPLSENNERVFKNPVPVLMQRCPPRDRVDFDVFLKAYGLNLDEQQQRELTDFQLLGYTGAPLSTDTFCILNPFKAVSEAFTFVMRVSGVHHHYAQGTSFSKEDAQILTGKLLVLNDEPTNKIDTHAQRLDLEGKTFGYVNRLLACQFKTWKASNRLESIRVFRCNGRKNHVSVYAIVSVGEEVN
jgi:hypothetical protein